jgi:hypothetical protein
MANFSLDDIRAAAEKKYGDTTIDLGDEQMVLVNPLRLDKEKRKALTSIQERSEEGADEGDVMREALRLATSTPAAAEKFIDIAGDDLTLLATVFESYTEGVQMGEASASQG